MKSIWTTISALSISAVLILGSCAKDEIASGRAEKVESTPVQAEQPKFGKNSMDKQAAKAADLQVPISYQIRIQGKTEAATFADIAAILEITPTRQPDPNPVLVALYPANAAAMNFANGSLFWQSYTPDLPTADEHFSRVTLEGNRVRMEVNPSATFRSDVMWFTKMTDTLTELPGMQGQPGQMSASAEVGTLTFQVEGDLVTGEVEITGTSDMGTPSTYTATLTGQAL
jgi:hypothetical protein